MNHKTNLGIRAVLHTARKWKKTLLVFFLLLAITTLVMSGLAIADAQEEQSEELRGVTGASFTVNANNGYTLQPVTDEMIEEIAAIDGVESYNTSHWTIVNLYHQDTLMIGTDEREYVADLFYGTGCFDSEYSPLFLSGALRLTEGRHVTEGNSGIILYEGLAEKYGLSLGDTLEIKTGIQTTRWLSVRLPVCLRSLQMMTTSRQLWQSLQPYTITRTISLRIWILCLLFLRPIRPAMEMGLLPLTSLFRTPLSWKVLSRKCRTAPLLTGTPITSP